MKSFGMGLDYTETIWKILNGPLINTVSIMYEKIDCAARRLVSEGRHPPLRTCIYGASWSGRLTYIAAHQVRNISLCGFWDRDERFSVDPMFDIKLISDLDADTDKRLFGLPIYSSFEAIEEKPDLIICSLAPHHYRNVVESLQKAGIDHVPIIFIAETELVSVSDVGVKDRILIGTLPRSGTYWLKAMISPILNYLGLTEFFKVSSMKGNDPTINETIINDLQEEKYTIGHYPMLPMTPELRHHIESGKIKAVLLVRDPRDAVVSDAYHQKYSVPIDAFHDWSLDQVLNKFIVEVVRLRLKNFLTWMEIPGIHHVRYEDLHRDVFGTMKKLLNFLELNISDGELRYVIETGSFKSLSGGRDRGQEDKSSHYRKGIVGEWKNHFTKERRMKFKQVAGDLLIKMGYEDDYDW